MSEKNPYRRSPLFYVGDKYKLLPQLMEYFPSDTDRFIEPFCGGGSVFLNVQAQHYLLNDWNPYLIRLHRFLMKSAQNPEKFWKRIQRDIEKYGLTATFMGRNLPPEYRRLYKKTYFSVYNKEAYLRMRNDFNDDQSNMELLYLLLIYGFNRMIRFNEKGQFNLPCGNVDFNKNVCTALNDYFAYVPEKDIRFSHLDFDAFLKKAKPTPDDFVYLDPPYLITGSEYNKKWKEDSETRLLKCMDRLDSSHVRFAVSNVIRYEDRHNEIFRQWAENYKVVPIESNYINYHNNKKKNMTEVLVKNF